MNAIARAAVVLLIGQLVATPLSGAHDALAAKAANTSNENIRSTRSTVSNSAGQTDRGRPGWLRVDWADGSQAAGADSDTQSSVGQLSDAGRTAMAAGDPASAARQFATALRQAPDDPALLNNLATALAMLGDIGGALELLRRAVTLAPDRDDIRANLRILSEWNRRRTPISTDTDNGRSDPDDDLDGASRNGVHPAGARGTAGQQAGSEGIGNPARQEAGNNTMGNPNEHGAGKMRDTRTGVTSAVQPW